MNDRMRELHTTTKNVVAAASSSNLEPRCLAQVLQNPLEIEDIISVVIENLDFASLTIARLVSSRWERRATRKIMKDGCFVTIPTEFHHGVEAAASTLPTRPMMDTARSSDPNNPSSSLTHDLPSLQPGWAKWSQKLYRAFYLTLATERSPGRSANWTGLFFLVWNGKFSAAYREFARLLYYYPVRIWLKLQQSQELLVIEEFMYRLSSHSIKVECLSIKSLKDCAIFRSLSLISPKVTELTFLVSQESVQQTIDATDKLCLLLEDLPCLKILRTNALDLSPRPFWTKTSSSSASSRGTKFLEKLASLQQLWLERRVNLAQILVYEPIQDRLKAMRKLSVDPGLPVGGPVFDFLHFYVHSTIQWPIQFVSIVLPSWCSVLVVRAFLFRMEDTLKELEVTFCTSKPSTRSWPWFQRGLHNNWYVPDRLVNLTILTVRESPEFDFKRKFCEEATINESPGLVTLCVALQLPKLKQVNMLSPYAGRFENVLNLLKTRYIIYIHYSFFQSPSIRGFRTVTMDTSIVGGGPFFVMPNLKKLSLLLSLEEPGPTLLALVFLKMMSLEVLELELKQNSNSSLADENILADVDSDWDSVLTGVKNGRRRRCSVIDDIDMEAPSLEHLKCLRSLVINCEADVSISDFLIYNNLVYLDTLRSLRISKTIKFSSIAVQLLQEVLGFGVCIDVGIAPDQNHDDDQLLAAGVP